MSKPDDIHLTVSSNFEEQLWRVKVMAQIAWDLLAESEGDDDRVRHAVRATAELSERLTEMFLEGATA